MKSHLILLVLIVVTLCSCNCQNEKPKDFDVFWDNTVKELDTIVSSEKIKDSIVEGKRWSLFKIRSFNNIHFYSWVSEPELAGSFPVKVRFMGFGERVPNKNEISKPWFLKEKNTINMLVEIRGQGMSIDEIKFDGFLTNGLTNKENYVYRGAFMDAVKSVDFIAKNPKSNGNIIVTGGSQGAALSIVAAALNPKVTMCVIGFPFLTDIANYDKKLWPMNSFIQYAKNEEIDLVNLKNTLSYFDMINFAERINVPIFIRTQEKDLITPSEGVINFFNQIKSTKKNLYVEPCIGHGCSSKSKTANDLEKVFIKNNQIAIEQL